MAKKIAVEHLKIGWAIAYPAGAEVPDDALKSDIAKQFGWADKVAGAGTKAAQSVGTVAGESGQ